jgi:hypothetical protein
MLLEGPKLDSQNWLSARYDLSECGVSTVLPRSTSAGSYILFGNDAINGEWPWQALFFKHS